MLKDAELDDWGGGLVADAGQREKDADEEAGQAEQAEREMLGRRLRMFWEAAWE